MSNPELQTIKEDVIRVKGTIGEIERDIKEIRDVLARKRLVIFGDGSPGLTSKVNNILSILKGIKEWQNGWREITNYEDFKAMKGKINFLNDEVDGLKKWIYIGIGGVWVITIILQIFGPVLISKATELFK